MYYEGTLLPLNLFSSVTLSPIGIIASEDGKFTPQWSQDTKCFPYSSCCIILTPKKSVFKSVTQVYGFSDFICRLSWKGRKLLIIWPAIRFFFMN